MRDYYSYNYILEGNDCTSYTYKICNETLRKHVILISKTSQTDAS